MTLLLLLGGCGTVSPIVTPSGTGGVYVYKAQNNRTVTGQPLDNIDGQTNRTVTGQNTEAVTGQKNRTVQG